MLILRSETNAVDGSPEASGKFSVSRFLGARETTWHHQKACTCWKRKSSKTLYLEGILVLMSR